jgi:AraC family transcriptional activator of pobA
VSAAIPNFYLYGEPRRIVEDRFVHIEALIDRTLPSEWTIRPHAHPELSHIFHVTAGSGVLRADASLMPFSAPCLLVIPAGTIHGFDWSFESAGSVVTLASHHFASFVERDPDLAALFARATTLTCSADPTIGDRIVALMKELAWAAPGHRAAADAGLLDLLVRVLRIMGSRADAHRPASPQAALVARLRERIEQRFRLREPIEDHARALAVSSRRLRAACEAVAHQSPSDMLDERTMLEAQRSLIYGNLSVAEIGYALGFADPAYFSRFFRQRAGVSPLAFRTQSEARR